MTTKNELWWQGNRIENNLSALVDEVKLMRMKMLKKSKDEVETVEEAENVVKDKIVSVLCHHDIDYDIARQIMFEIMTDI